jgi:hypothetical protein
MEEIAKGFATGLGRGLAEIAIIAFFSLLSKIK